MAVVPDLPILSFRINWKEPVAERLSFLTDVLRSSNGAEQRRSLRPTPRRSYQADFLLMGNERTFWDLFINKLGGGELYAPVPWEVHALSTPLAVAGTRINFDTTFREWPYFEGDYAILIRGSAFDYEVVQIDGVDAGGVDLFAGLERAWVAGTKLLPLRRGVLSQIGDPAHKTATVATVSVEVRFNTGNPWEPAVDPSPVYAGLPVMLDEPNWVEDLSVQTTKDIALLDLSVGRTYQVDTTGRALVGQEHRWFLPGRKKLSVFRDMIYRNRGRAKSFWLPTFKSDFRLVSSPGSAATQITVENVGFSYTGGPTSGREYIAIKHSAGTILRKVTAAVQTSPTTERLSLDAPLGLALSPGQVRRISFVDTARFDSDDFEISHFGGADSHHEVSAIFRTFKNSRDPSGPDYLPIPLTAQSDAQCGTPAEDEDSDCHPRIPCPPWPVFLEFGTGPRKCNLTYREELILSGPLPPYIDENGTRYFQVNNPLFIRNEFHPEGFWSEGRRFDVGGSRAVWVGNGDGHYEFLETDTRGTEWHDPRLEGGIIWQVDFAGAGSRFQYNFAIGGDWHVQVQFPGGFCGSVGETLADFNISMCQTGGVVPNCACLMALRRTGEVDGSFYFEFDWTGP